MKTNELTGMVTKFSTWLLIILSLIWAGPVAAGPSTTVLTSSANPVALTASVTLTATVTGTSPTGTVSFKDGAATLGTVAVTSGIATFITSGLSSGSHLLTAVYGGDAGNASSTSAVVVLAVSPGPMKWQYGYDAIGRPTTTVDPNGLSNYTLYDRLGRPVQSQQPPNTGASVATITDFTYNAASDLTQVTDPRSLPTTYSPNGFRDIRVQASPDSGTSQYTHDAKGNILTSTDARGKVTTRTYDSLDRVTSVTYPTGTATTLEYDGGLTPTPAAKGELTKITDGSGSITYTYDALGRLTGKTQVTGAKTFTVGYTWGNSGSAMDKLTAITYPSGSRINYSYDAYGMVSGITMNPVNGNGVGVNAGTTVTQLSAITRNAENKLNGWTWASGRTMNIQYDSYGQVLFYRLGDNIGTGSAAGYRRSLVRDAAGRITGYVHQNNGVAIPGLDQTFTYDNLNRLISVTMAGASTQYTYDATGNRTSKVVGANTYTNTISATSNRVTQTQDVGGTFSVSYDAAGNVTGDGTNTFTYSDRGRMATATNAGGTVAYSYNALELRVSKSGPTALVPSGAVYYVYDESGKVLGEYDSAGNPVYETVYLASNAAMDISALPVGVMKRTGTAPSLVVTLYNLSADHLGAPRMVTRQSDEAIVWRWDTADAYGGAAANENPNGLGTFAYNQRFPGQVFDAETGLFQNWNREYNPRLGRYVQSDPIGLAGGINTYSYVAGNPVSFVDPMGLWAWGDPLDQRIVDAAAGFGDVLSFGATIAVREVANLNDQVDFCSTSYWAGTATGVAVHLIGFRTGGELRIGRNWRFAPWGNRTGDPNGRYPHYHRRGTPDESGKTPPGQGVGRHRPWQDSPVDRNWTDRF